MLVSGLQNTTGLQLGTDGMLYFAYALGNRGMVGRVDPQVCLANGGCSNDQVEIVLYSDLSAPLAGLTHHAGHAAVRPHHVHAGFVLGAARELKR